VARLLDWLDDRTGYRSLLRHALDEPVPGGASFAYVFGSVLTFCLVLQAVTGVFLAMYYSPSATDAWASVAFIEDQVTLGWFVRGLHSYGASAMVILAGLHLVQTALYGAYKRPRELNWIVGVILLGLILAFALTGYLLPWDQTGYWATKVATGIAGTSPLIGDKLQQLAQGGNEYGNLTITRFFAIHVFLLPGATFILVAVHVALFRKHGVTPRWGRSDESLRASVEPFWPNQLFRDAVAMAVAFAVLVGVNLYSSGVGLDAPADPSSNFDARPEWYFRPLFQLLKYFGGPMETIVALGTPVVVGGGLLALPFVDRGPFRDPRRRWHYLTALGVGVVGAGALTVLSLADDATDPALQERLARSEERAAEARALAKQHGVPAEGGMAVFTLAPHYDAKQNWAKHCAACHQGDQRKGPEIGPGYNSRAWIRDFLLQPNGDRFFGPTGIDKMEPVSLRGGELDAIVEFVYAQSAAPDADPALVERGTQLFEDGDCSNCHSADWDSVDEPGPNLGRRGTVDMLAAFIAEPGHPRWFGDHNQMPAFKDKLTADECRQLAEYLVFLRSAAPPDR
jgi:ubiquinol-cytochrome c reductase cytochrome b subunit